MASVNIPTRNKIIEYYCSDFILEQMVKNAKNKEVAAAFPDGKYDKRPNIIQYPSDVVQMAKKGITSFHFSAERWSNPMGLSAENYDLLRTGWDFIIDIDSKLGMEEAKIAARLIRKILRKYGIRNYGIKFSGSRGFHIILPWEMFPKDVDYRQLSTRYPEIPRILARFIRKKIARQLLKKLASLKTVQEFLEVNEKEGMSPFYLIEVEKDWGNRHMFRAPFSLNEKTWLVSVPVFKLKPFRKEDATMDNILKTKPAWNLAAKENEAIDLLTDAIDWYTTVKKEEKPKERKIIQWEKKIGEENFPPCIKLMLGGIEDGKKRSIFTLVNFLRMMNWSQEEIEQKVLEWNSKNKPALPASTVISHLRYHEKRETIPPANCSAGMYYSDIGLCRPDAVCKGNTGAITVKNPINYAFRKMKAGMKPKAKRGFSCGVCNQEFPSMRSLSIHMGRSH
jgi:DNA primase catalytic subunit